ncbi:FAS1 domain-containing protein [Desarmillaria tabescens]|uniref:FAS1 domain-containing protein n=1 Tax=Armillaria tabescens TaxID=1929756 RepID=A0AA39KCG5_ARMTA|nr:FAS1 domain-containing protein [Desarmillaria tabescens]KAK0458258.1 FAS1 domain-containing protein [Desarmillaria tabescens]
MFIALALLVTALQVPALAWNNTTQYLTGLGQALQGTGLTTLGSQAGRLNNTVIGRALLARLLLGNYTLFAPDNEAFANATNSSSLSSDDNLFALTILYHIVSGNFSSNNGTNSTSGTNATLEAATYPNVTIGRTLLDDPSVVQLEGNKSQVLVWSSVDGTVQMYNQPTSVSVQNSTVVENLFVNRINGILLIPPNVSDVLTAQNLTYLAGFLNSTSVTSSNGTNETVTDLLDGDSVHGFTFFAPDNAAIELEGFLTSVAQNTTALLSILSNHIVNGTTVYSPSITPSENLTSTGGEPLTFTTNSSGTFVHSGSSSARIIKTDILCKNGVLHMIDRVLNNTETNPEAASSAYESATSFIASSTTETGPVGEPTAIGSVGTNAETTNSAQGKLATVELNINTMFAAVCRRHGMGCAGYGLYLTVVVEFA